MTKQPMCSTCKFWRADGPQGQCRRMCPMGVTVRGDKIVEGHGWLGIWPLTNADDWCGEHAPKEEPLTDETRF